jgi:lipopolysaccharide/colanic/teichoic acid biosynthesis glycosyltransferase
MVEQMSLGGGHVAESSMYPKEVSKLEDSGGLHLVVDMTEESPQLELDSRCRLTPDAALLIAPRWQLGVKRLMDVLGATLALLGLAPILVATTMAVKLTSPGPLLFSQRRTGKNSRGFSFFKFRSMRLNAEAERYGLIDLNEIDGPVFKIRQDPRLTTVGRFIRRASIDELPQLWNVLRGEMSLVGPRPLPTEEAAQCSEWESQRLYVKPGITCIWQVSGRSELDFETWVRMDIEYIEKWSLWLDLQLLARTIPAVLSRRGAY